MHQSILECEHGMFVTSNDQNNSQLSVVKQRFLVKRGQQLISLPTSEILYFYSREKVSFAHTIDNKEFVIPFTIEQISMMVCGDHFFRVSRRHVICHQAIHRVLVWFNGKLKLEIRAAVPEEVIISRDRVHNFRIWMGE
ncbi:LytTR family transcriptional regulator [Pseudoflavitalea sp. G-6-1-2]|uniref:LytR/AlgR family response regulator transcription factor n=1 Tax=Pseudoflavitalea sp. G-6-1-2 TaxID=2728841 RepID=UPI00146A3E34|nr:LytTR family DNA-binding domain-containing protein [Pseudoflavitalea sp. G-6-1-2]NML22716.1 LytTR family transcriptional regulator [Pseudoflavitalea sp. G-6-1-2]